MNLVRWSTQKEWMQGAHQAFSRWGSACLPYQLCFVIHGSSTKCSFAVWSRHSISGPGKGKHYVWIWVGDRVLSTNIKADNTRKFSWTNPIYGVSKSPQPLFWIFLLRLFLFSCLIFPFSWLFWSFIVWLFPFFLSDVSFSDLSLSSVLLLQEKKERSEKSRSGGRVRAQYLVTLGCHFAWQGQHLVSRTECFLRDSWSRERGVCQYKMRLRSGKSKLWRRTGCGLTVWSLWNAR